MVCLLHFSSCPECIEVDFPVLFAKLSWLILVVLFDHYTVQAEWCWIIAN